LLSFGRCTAPEIGAGVLTEQHLHYFDFADDIPRR
jgi:hypothetical protein